MSQRVHSLIHSFIHSFIHPVSQSANLDEAEVSQSLPSADQLHQMFWVILSRS